ncbi:hypothetical protein IB223_07015 [Pseudoxanthomonas sp. PXM03]|jgi:hypothetical protein|uniref:methylamine utilization protein MauJ n=1 Tax=Pseudoxanthomonas sp. PXM03 TaxID=2769284 RepID=UPI00177CBE06|nr:methylamine utilization protein MauJ [Pseudoxanthomonas sp. PXM03]MBD9435836.1 hypothetical protein [Pseudoxanthomonas sp. PXM03]
MSAHINTRASWPNQFQVMWFQGSEFLLLPATDDLAAGIAVNMRTNSLSSPEEARTAISRFASVIAWTEQSSLAITDFTYSPTRPVHSRIRRFTAMSSYMDIGLQAIERVSDPRALRGLALFREGLSSSNDFYAALSFFKVIENFVNGDVRGAWFKSAVPKLVTPEAMARIHAIETSTRESIGDYLRKQGRHAVAHAKEDDAVDPDVDQERYRFSLDRVVYKELARLAIEEFVDAPHSGTHPKVQQNRIQGFCDAQDGQVLAWIRYQDRPIPAAQLMLPSPATLVVKRMGDTLAIRGMEVEDWAVGATAIDLTFVGKEHAGAIKFRFDLERRDVHPIGPPMFRKLDSSLSRAQLDEIASFFQFDSLLWGNGCAWIIDEADNKVWGVTGMVMPVNALHDPGQAIPFIEQLGSLIHERTRSDHA